MIGLDTNVLVRYIVQDSPAESKAASRLIEGRCSAESPGFIGTLVLAEMVWVLRRAYSYDKGVVAGVLRQLLQTAELAVENRAMAWAALREFQQGTADFADYLIGHTNHAHGCSATYTFNRRAAAGRYFEILSK